MSGSRKSTRLRKPITTIDQNLDDEETSTITSKVKTSIRRVSNKRPSTDDNDEQDFITPIKRQKKKASTNTTKTSPYFNQKLNEKKTDSPTTEIKKSRKPRGKKAKNSIDENTTLSNDATSVITKSKSNGELMSKAIEFLD